MRRLPWLMVRGVHGAVAVPRGPRARRAVRRRLRRAAVRYPGRQPVRGRRLGHVAAHGGHRRPRAGPRRDGRPPARRADPGLGHRRGRACSSRRCSGTTWRGCRPRSGSASRRSSPRPAWPPTCRRRSRTRCRSSGRRCSPRPHRSTSADPSWSPSPCCSAASASRCPGVVFAVLAVMVATWWGWVGLIVGPGRRGGRRLAAVQRGSGRYFEEAPEIFAAVRIGDRS